MSLSAEEGAVLDAAGVGSLALLTSSSDGEDDGPVRCGGPEDMSADEGPVHLCESTAAEDPGVQVRPESQSE